MKDSADATALKPPSPEVAQRMRAQRRRDTAPELALRRALWARGLRYRVDFKAVGTRRRVDIAFTRRRVAVFVDGCFWHLCPMHSTIPKSNREWWIDKLESNERRDRYTDQVLEDNGWIVVRVWEHEPASEAAARVEAVVHSR
jgi:DNA mismatch endonuclease, patch repair protein